MKRILQKIVATFWLSFSCVRLFRICFGKTRPWFAEHVKRWYSAFISLQTFLQHSSNIPSKSLTIKIICLRLRPAAFQNSHQQNVFIRWKGRTSIWFRLKLIYLKQIWSQWQKRAVPFMLRLFMCLLQTHDPHHRCYSKNTRMQKYLDTTYRKVCVCW